MSDGKRVCPQCGTVYDEAVKYCTRDGAMLVASAPEDPFVGKVIDDRYRLQSRIGSGSFGLVYRATHERMPRELAVKILSESMSKDPQWVARFEREVRAQAILDHPNITSVFDYGLNDLVGYFIVMEYLRGEDLAARLEREHTLPILEIYKIMFEAGGALAAAHAIDIIHRDIKPENVFLAEGATDEGGYSVRLLDFGIAKVARPTKDLPDLKDILGSHPNYIAGSPYTMSPEQIRCEGVDKPSDIYSLGCVLYEMLTGNVPFYGSSAQELWDKHLNEQPAAPSLVEGADWIIPDLDEILLWMLAKDPRDRPPSVEDILDALEYIRPRVEEAWAHHHLLPTGRLRDATTQPQQLAATNTPKTFHPNRTHRVLVVDDERMIRSLVRRLMSRAGYEPILMENGEKALRWLRKNLDVDAIILDLLMPGLDGFTVMKMARAQGYEGPIIMLSGLQSDAIHDEALRRGATAFLNKAKQLHQVTAVLGKLQTAAAAFHSKRMQEKGATTVVASAEDIFDVEFGGPMPDPFAD